MSLLEPNKHHAVHLASLRKLCESNPLKLLKRHKATQGPSSPSSSPRSPAQPLSVAPVPAPVAEENDFRFDDLDLLEEVNQQGNEGSVAASAGASSWSRGLFGGKASKFAAP